MKLFNIIIINLLVICRYLFIIELYLVNPEDSQLQMLSLCYVSAPLDLSEKC